MRIGILTSSRADFGIYSPLIDEIAKDNFFEINIIAFGTHLSETHGFTLDEIVNSGFKPKYILNNVIKGDTPKDITINISEICKQFAEFWHHNYKDFDLIFCLGDRFEMFAAVISGIPFSIKFAHFHGGEVTIGSIDNFFRHSITLASKLHFTATDYFSTKVKQIIGNDNNIYTVGSISLSNLSKIKLLQSNEFYEKWGIDIEKPTILFTFHPETVLYNDVQVHANLLIDLIEYLSQSFQILVTMPNADTNGSLIRKALVSKFNNNKKIFLRENLGRVSYLTALKYSSFLLGNTSSGIIEAASFNKFVINLGKRQLGRLASKNVLNSNFDFDEILEKVNQIKEKNYLYKGSNIYFKENTIEKIIDILKQKSVEFI